MSKRLYVGNLSYNATDEDLRSLFSKYGNVESASVLMDKMSGRSRGFGFVEMSVDEEGQAAIDGLNGQEHDGRKLVVNEARPKTEGGAGGPGGSRGPRRSFGGGGRFGDR